MKTSFLLLLILLNFNGSLHAQVKSKQDGGTLFQFGVATAFIGGLYDAGYSFSLLKQQGDFGLGAPDKLDGEMVMLKGKIYQTQYTGHTFEVKGSGSTSLAFVNFFQKQREIVLPHTMKRNELYSYLDSLLGNNPNGIYAIHIQGNFHMVKTRAFPPPEKPYRPLAEMLDRQHFFTFDTVAGDLVGYKLPLYLEALSIHGYHFHFLSADRNKGGHIIDFIIENGTIKIDTLHNYVLKLPESAGFNQFDFAKDRKNELKSVETGNK